MSMKFKERFVFIDKEADVFADGAANRVRPKSGHVLILEPSSAYFSRARFIFGHAGHSPSLLLDFRKLLAIIPGVLLLTFFVILTFFCPTGDCF